MSEMYCRLLWVGGLIPFLNYQVWAKFCWLVKDHKYTQQNKSELMKETDVKDQIKADASSKLESIIQPGNT